MEAVAAIRSSYWPRDTKFVAIGGVWEEAVLHSVFNTAFLSENSEWPHEVGDQ